MERGAWTEERLDDLAGEMRRGFDRMDRDIRDLRTDLSGQLESLRLMMLRIGGGLLGGLIFGFLSVLAAILLRGA